MKFFLLVILLTNITIPSFALEKGITGYTNKFELSPQGTSQNVKLTCLIPNNIERVQKVLNIDYSITPHKIFIENGNRYAEFIFDTLNCKKKITIKVEIEIYRYDFESIKRNNKKPSKSEIPFNYLNEEKYINKNDNLIKTVAPRLRGTDTLMTIMNTFKFIHNNLTYDINKKAISAVEALDAKKGDCSEFSDLFVTLCRANNIPARVVYGFVTEYTKSPRHAWAEVYLEKCGWVRLEPTTNSSKNFVTLKNKYIQLSTERRDKILNYSYYRKCTYLGAPIIINEKLKVK